MKKNSLSVALATYNEETNLARCLEAVKDIADEIVIVDGSSTDNTVKIARKFKAKVVVTNNPPIFHINKQKAIDLCRGEWVLQLDADEVVSPQLAKEIRKITSMTEKQLRERVLTSSDTKLFMRHQSLVEKRDGKIGEKSGEIVAFFIPRKNFFLGSFLRHGGVYPDGVVRLVKKGKAEFPCESVHEQIRIQGRISWLENSLLHYDSPTFSRYLSRADRYTSLTAIELKEKKLPINLFNTVNYLVLLPFKVFLRNYFRHKGFLDGFPGFIFAMFSGLHFAVSYVKLWELVKK